jgi:hypothetical protein
VLLITGASSVTIVWCSLYDLVMIYSDLFLSHHLVDCQLSLLKDHTSFISFRFFFAYIHMLLITGLSLGVLKDHKPFIFFLFFVAHSHILLITVY